MSVLIYRINLNNIIFKNKFFNTWSD